MRRLGPGRNPVGHQNSSPMCPTLLGSIPTDGANHRDAVVLPLSTTDQNVMAWDRWLGFASPIHYAFDLGDSRPGNHVTSAPMKLVERDDVVEQLTPTVTRPWTRRLRQDTARKGHVSLRLGRAWTRNQETLPAPGPGAGWLSTPSGRPWFGRSRRANERRAPAVGVRDLVHGQERCPDMGRPQGKHG